MLKDPRAPEEVGGGSDLQDETGRRLQEDPRVRDGQISGDLLQLEGNDRVRVLARVHRLKVRAPGVKFSSAR